MCRHLTRRGYLESDEDVPFLTEAASDDESMDGLRMSAVTYRIAAGPHAGRRVATLQTLPGIAEDFSSDAGKVGGFSLHAGISAREHESAKLERLCRYITRPAVCEKRIALTTSGQVRRDNRRHGTRQKKRAIPPMRQRLCRKAHAHTPETTQKLPSPRLHKQMWPPPRPLHCPPSVEKRPRIVVDCFAGDTERAVEFSMLRWAGFSPSSRSETSIGAL